MQVTDRLVRRMTELLLRLTLVLLAAHAVATYLRHGPPDAALPALRRLLDLEAEGSLGTWVTGLLLAGLSAVAALCVVDDRRRGVGWHRNWWLLAAAFAYVSADELLALHEQVGDLLQRSLDTSGALLFAWIIPAALAVLVFVLLQFRLLLHLPRRTRSVLLGAGTLCIAAAVGLGAAEGAVYSAAGLRRTLLYDVLVALEESLELAASVVALGALVRFLLYDSPQELVLDGVSGPGPVQPPRALRRRQERPEGRRP